MARQAVLLFGQAQKTNRKIGPEHAEKTLLYPLRSGRLSHHRGEPVQLAQRGLRLPIPEQFPGETMAKFEHLAGLLAGGDPLAVGRDPAGAVGPERFFFRWRIRGGLPFADYAIEAKGHGFGAGGRNSGGRRRAAR